MEMNPKKNCLYSSPMANPHFRSKLCRKRINCAHTKAYHYVPNLAFPFPLLPQLNNPSCSQLLLSLPQHLQKPNLISRLQHDHSISHVTILGRKRIYKQKHGINSSTLPRSWRRKRPRTSQKTQANMKSITLNGLATFKYQTKFIVDLDYYMLGPHNVLSLPGKC